MKLRPLIEQLRDLTEEVKVVELGSFGGSPSDPGYFTYRVDFNGRFYEYDVYAPGARGCLAAFRKHHSHGKWAACLKKRAFTVRKIENDPNKLPWELMLHEPKTEAVDKSKLQAQFKDLEMVSQGRTIVSVDQDGWCTVMYPTGDISEFANREKAEKAIKKWYKKNLKSDSDMAMGVGHIEWRWE